MSATKLTLRIDAALIKRAKAYSKKTGKSISQIVADYFAFLNGKFGQKIPPLPPVTRSLKGLLRGAKITEEDYKKHLKDKYL